MDEVSSGSQGPGLLEYLVGGFHQNRPGKQVMEGVQVGEVGEEFPGR